MNKTPRLSKSKIEYLNYQWSFYSGCENKKLGICQVENCWAEDITKRMKHNYPNGFNPTVYPEAFLSPLYLKKPSIIGCAFMGDLFGDWMLGKTIRDPEGELWSGQGIMENVFHTIERCPWHTFLFLTKCPWNLPKWSPFPDNCWVGVSVTNEGITYPDMMEEACRSLAEIKATVKYISFEPLLSSIYKLDLLKIWGINWVIIGAQTKPCRPPKIEWVQEIVEACDKAGVAVFLKNNLWKLLVREPGIPPIWARGRKGQDADILRQEMPG